MKIEGGLIGKLLRSALILHVWPAQGFYHSSATARQGRCARPIEDGLPTSSPEVFDVEPTMETACDNESAPLLVFFHIGLTNFQAQVYSNTAMAED